MPTPGATKRVVRHPGVPSCGLGHELVLELGPELVHELGLDRTSYGREARYVATGGRRVVVIDDDPSIREVAAVALSAVGGHEVHTAGTGAEGLDLARRVRPDAILLDVMMPVHDGPTVLGRLRAVPELRDVPVVFLTAKVGSQDISRLDGMGATGVLTKPFNPLDLSAELAQVLGWPS